MSTLSDHERLALAVALLRRKARVSIVHHETGVPRERLRRLHREIHGRSAASGQIPMLGGATIQTRAQQVYAGLFAALYVRYSERDTTRQIDLQAVIAAHDLYLSLVPPAPRAPRLDFSAAWAIARDLRVGSAELRTCNACAPARRVIWCPVPAGWRPPARSVRCMRDGVGAPRLRSFPRSFLARWERTGRSHPDALDPATALSASATSGSPGDGGWTTRRGRSSATRSVR